MARARARAKDLHVYSLVDFPTFCDAHRRRGEVYTQSTSQLAYNHISGHVPILMLRIPFDSSQEGNMPRLRLVGYASISIGSKVSEMEISDEPHPLIKLIKLTTSIMLLMLCI